MLSPSWRYVPLGPALGIERGEIEATMRLNGIKRKRWPLLFEQIRVMEVAALGVMKRM